MLPRDIPPELLAHLMGLNSGFESDSEEDYDFDEDSDGPIYYDDGSSEDFCDDDDDDSSRDEELPLPKELPPVSVLFSTILSPTLDYMDCGLSLFRRFSTNNTETGTAAALLSHFSGTLYEILTEKVSRKLYSARQGFLDPKEAKS